MEARAAARQQAAVAPVHLVEDLIITILRECQALPVALAMPQVRIRANRKDPAAMTIARMVQARACLLDAIAVLRHPIRQKALKQ